MSDAITATRHCPNCDHRLAPWDRYCSQCGQHAQNHAPTLWEFVHEWIAHYVAAEGVLWKSLWALMLRPGFLTLEYLKGRRRRYVLPLRLVLTLGLVFFLLVKWVGGEEEVVQIGPKPPVAASTSPAASSPKAAPPAAEPESYEPTVVVRHAPAWLRPRLERADAAFYRDPKAFNEKLAQSMLAMAPYAILVSIPAYAGLLKLLYWARRRTYGEHFVFAMHLHAFWYGCLLLVLVPSGLLTFSVWLWSNVYPVLALRRVHGGPWWSVLLRAAILAGLHLLLLMGGLLALLVLGAMGA
jgi:hypothetical protein